MMLSSRTRFDISVRAQCLHRNFNIAVCGGMWQKGMHGTNLSACRTIYNLLYREDEKEMIPFCKATGVGCVPLSAVKIIPWCHQAK